MKLFFCVLARDGKYVKDKIEELERLCVPYLIICGSKLNHSKIVYREPRGKYDAINFGINFIPEDVDVVALNDVDTKIFNIEAALEYFKDDKVGLVFARVSVEEGPQRTFYQLLDSIRRRIPIAASGELMFIKRDVLAEILPLRPCKAEDSYIMFKVLEFRRKVVFCEKCWVVTKRTKTDEKEETYKRKTVCGLYQAISYSNPPILVKFFYTILPFISPLLLILRKKGYFWMKGILLGFIDYIKGDKSGLWIPIYME